MKVVGLIVEYNPFHNGHKYHIEEAKRITGADYVIAVMSGNFVQRGTPAIIDKYSRTKMALCNGVDLVFELPVCYATGSAEFFAHGAVSLLDKLGIVDYLCFGSESGDIRLLNEAARFLSDTPNSFENSLQTFLKDGLTYPAARLQALKHSLNTKDTLVGQALEQVLSEPNNILGIEYIKALLTMNSSIIPMTINRISAGYHDVSLSSTTAKATSSSTALPVISSATAIRKAIHSQSNPIDVSFSDLNQSVPEDVYAILEAGYLKTYPVKEEDFSHIIKYKLLTESKLALAEYMDISDDLADRLKNITDFNCSICELTNIIKTKNMTLTRINRALIHILLNIHKEAFIEYNENGYSQYARVLGVKKEASHLLRKIEGTGTFPIITKISKARDQLDTLGMRMLSEDIAAAHIYNQAVYEKYATPCTNEYKHGIVII